MSATNEANINTMMERMNALVADKEGRQTTHQDKENTPPGGNLLPPPSELETDLRKKEAQVPTSKLQNFCPPLTEKLLQTRGKQDASAGQAGSLSILLLDKTGDHNVSNAP